MTLTIGTGPFGNQSSGSFNFDMGALKPHTLYFEDSPRRVRVVFEGETVADSKRAKLMHETGLLPIYYFPQEDVRSEFLEQSDHSTHCPFKGDASYWSVKVGERVAENAAWGYPDPLEDAPPLAGYVAFYWNKMEDVSILANMEPRMFKCLISAVQRRCDSSLGFLGFAKWLQTEVFNL